MMKSSEIKEIYNENKNKRDVSTFVNIRTKRVLKLIKIIENKINKKVKKYYKGKFDSYIFFLKLDPFISYDELLSIEKYCDDLGYYASITRENPFFISIYISWVL